MPFDRLVRAVDEWAGRSGRRDVFAQLGESAFVPIHIESVPMIGPGEFKRRVAEAEVIVAHAGAGTILTALTFCKPILVMPRKASLMETRNEHQTASARRFAERGVTVAWDEHELAGHLDRLDELATGQKIGPFASESLIRALRDFIESGDARLPGLQPQSKL